MDELTFIKKKSSRGRKDIVLNTTMAHSSKNERRVSITFRNNTERLITLEKEAYIIVAILGRRLYFKRSTIVEGFKISSNKRNSSHNKYVYISENNSEELFKFVDAHKGDYNLKYDDDDRNLHYIEIE